MDYRLKAANVVLWGLLAVWMVAQAVQTNVTAEERCARFGHVVACWVDTLEF